MDGREGVEIRCADSRCGDAGHRNARMTAWSAQGESRAAPFPSSGQRGTRKRAKTPWRRWNRCGRFHPEAKGADLIHEQLLAALNANLARSRFAPRPHRSPVPVRRRARSALLGGTRKSCDRRHGGPQALQEVIVSCPPISVQTLARTCPPHSPCAGQLLDPAPAKVV